MRANDCFSRLLSRHACRAIAAFLLVMSLSVGLEAQAPSASEDEIRAAMVLHLLLFVDWPASKVDSTHTQFKVCVLGVDPIRPALERVFHDKTVASKPVVILRLSATDNLDSCHVLYVGFSAHKDMQKLVPALQQASVLTVSERSNTSDPGQVIGFPVEEDHIKIEVNLHSAQLSKLTISSRLLHLATVAGNP